MKSKGHLKKLKKLKSEQVLALALILGLIGGLLGGMLSNLTAKVSSPVTQLFVDEPYVSAWETAIPSVVTILADKDFPQLGLSETISSGTGFIVDREGFIVTNRHVVQDDSLDYTVILFNGQSMPAEVLGKDSKNDLALLKVNATNLKAMTFADSDKIKIGQPVLAIGNAAGLYRNTSTAGIISAINRQVSVQVSQTQSFDLLNLIQTDAAINPGNSGGPLVNRNGHLVGMNTAIDESAQGIGFAIPSSDILETIEAYKKYGTIKRPGIQFTYQITSEGAQLTSNWENGGLQKGDLLLSLDGKKFTESYTPEKAIRSLFIGDTIKLQVKRGDRSETISVDL